MYICIYIYLLFIHILICIHLYICRYIHIPTYMYVHIYLSIYIYIYICRYIHILTYMYIYAYLSALYTYVRIYIPQPLHLPFHRRHRQHHEFSLHQQRVTGKRSFRSFCSWELYKWERRDQGAERGCEGAGGIEKLMIFQTC